MRLIERVGRSRLAGYLLILPWRSYKEEIASLLNSSHKKWENYLSGEFDKEGINILEISSRNVTGDNHHKLFRHANYTGFDIYQGENVDVVGDAHKLSN